MLKAQKDHGKNIFRFQRTKAAHEFIRNQILRINYTKSFDFLTEPSFRTASAEQNDGLHTVVRDIREVINDLRRQAELSGNSDAEDYSSDSGPNMDEPCPAPFIVQNSVQSRMTTGTVKQLRSTEVCEGPRAAQQESEMSLPASSEQSRSEEDGSEQEAETELISRYAHLADEDGGISSPDITNQKNVPGEDLLAMIQVVRRKSDQLAVCTRMSAPCACSREAQLFVFATYRFRARVVSSAP